MKQIIIDEKTEELMQDLSYDFTTLRHGFNLLQHCFQNDIYSETPIELCSFMYILEEYVKKLKSDYNAIEDILGIER